jgi:hypothetical protein
MEPCRTTFTLLCAYCELFGTSGRRKNHWAALPFRTRPYEGHGRSLHASSSAVGLSRVIASLTCKKIGRSDIAALVVTARERSPSPPEHAPFSARSEGLQAYGTAPASVDSCARGAVGPTLDTSGRRTSASADDGVCGETMTSQRGGGHGDRYSEMVQRGKRLWLHRP